jgi:carboxylesterase
MAISQTQIIPGGEPFLLPGGLTGCLLLHGFTSMPEEMRGLGDYLARQAYTVLGIRLAGHGTHPRDMARVRYQDWLGSVEDGLNVLRGSVQRIFIIGQSMGGVLGLVAAAENQVAGVVALSTPCRLPPRGVRVMLRMLRVIRPTVRKPVERSLEWRERREAGYPAYASYPLASLLELIQLQRVMLDDLPRVDAPVLLIHSRSDTSVAVESSEKIYAELGSQDKEIILLDGMDHSLVRDPRRMEVFKAIDKFLAQRRSS